MCDGYRTAVCIQYIPYIGSVPGGYNGFDRVSMLTKLKK